MHSIRTFFIAPLNAAVLCVLWSSIALGQPRKPVIGWVERAMLQPGGILVHAKIDTGADYSSLNAHNIEAFDRDGAPWVRAVVTNRFGNDIPIEMPVHRYASIKKHDGKTHKRPVVRFKLCIGGVLQSTDVNLVDRTNFEYQMLVGRSFLSGNVTVDPAVTFTIEPQCTGVRE